MSGNQQRGNKNRATLAVARTMVAYMLAVERRKQDSLPAEQLGGAAAAQKLAREYKTSGSFGAQAARSRR
jgi:hypothetical protein